MNPECLRNLLKKSLSIISKILKERSDHHEKIIICIITLIISITAGIGSLAVNDLGSYQQWMNDNRPLIKANLHKDKSHKENRREKDNKYDKHDKRINTRSRKSISPQRSTIRKTAITGKAKTIIMKNRKGMKNGTIEM